MLRSLCWAGVIALLLAVAGVSYAMPEWTTELGVDFWDVQTLNRQIEQDGRQIEDLDAKTMATVQRLREKTAIAADLVAGNVTLCEAATRYRNLNAAAPHVLATLRDHYPDCSDDERHCRNLLDFVGSERPPSPETDACLKRCNAELDRLRRQDGGKLRLAH